MFFGINFANIKTIVSKNKLLLVIIAVAGFLRFFNLENITTFLGDQGRDAIIIKRIITLEHWPAIGPTSSVGQVFLGPFFYYLIAPFLFLFRFNPVGMAVAGGFFSVVGIIGAYIALRKEINKAVAFLFILLVGFSFTQINFARFSWNPNLLPIFSFFTLFFFGKALKEHSRLHAVLAGAFLSFSIQLHYLAILIIPTLFLFWIIQIIASKEKTKDFINTLFSAGSFIFFSSPLIIFDLKHDFINSKSFIRVFTEQKVLSNASPWFRFVDTIYSFSQSIVNLSANNLISILILIGVFIYFCKRRFFKDQSILQIYFLNFFVYLLLFSFINSFHYPHYYAAVYYSFFVITAVILAEIQKRQVFLFLLVIPIMAFYLITNAINYSFLYHEGSRQIWRASAMAKAILSLKPQIPYQIVALPSTETTGHIRYFLEILGPRPLPEDSYNQPKELIVLCYEKCNATTDPQWQIAAFKNKKLDKITKFENITIYKVVHEK